MNAQNLRCACALGSALTTALVVIACSTAPEPAPAPAPTTPAATNTPGPSAPGPTPGDSDAATDASADASPSGITTCGQYYTLNPDNIPAKDRAFCLESTTTHQAGNCCTSDTQCSDMGGKCCPYGSPGCGGHYSCECYKP